MTAEKTQNRIREFRQAKGITQDQLAEALGVTQAEIAQLEARGRNKRLEKWLLMADFFGVSVQELYGWTPKKFSVQKED